MWQKIQIWPKMGPTPFNVFEGFQGPHFMFFVSFVHIGARFYQISFCFLCVLGKDIFLSSTAGTYVKLFFWLNPQEKALFMKLEKVKTKFFECKYFHFLVLWVRAWYFHADVSFAVSSILLTGNLVCLSAGYFSSPKRDILGKDRSFPP